MTDEAKPTEEALRHAWPQALTDMVTIVAAAYQREGQDAESAREQAFTAVRALAQYHGGRMFYLPKGESLDRAIRDRRIFEEMGKRSAKDLAVAHGLTEQRVYEIYREQRMLFQQRVQHDMFTSDAD